MKITKKRADGTGSIFFSRGKGQWVGQFYAYDLTLRKRVTRRRFFEERIDAEIWLRESLRREPTMSKVFVSSPAQRKATSRTVKPMLAVDAAERALADADRLGWDHLTTAQVIVASLKPSRLRLGVYGPCWYCGDILADTVDHMKPQALGGGDNRGNVVSACRTCNYRKGTLSVEAFLASLAPTENEPPVSHGISALAPAGGNTT